MLPFNRKYKEIFRKVFNQWSNNIIVMTCFLLCAVGIKTTNRFTNQSSMLSISNFKARKESTFSIYLLIPFRLLLWFTFTKIHIHLCWMKFKFVKWLCAPCISCRFFRLHRVKTKQQTNQKNFTGRKASNSIDFDSVGKCFESKPNTLQAS